MGNSIVNSKIKIPIRYKLLAASLIMTTVVVGLITFTMAKLFHDDKKVYIHDLTSTMIVNAAQETRGLLKGYQERLQFFARLMVNNKLSTEVKNELLEEIFIDFPNLLSVTVIDKHNKRVTLYDPDVLKVAGIAKSDMEAHRILHPLPIEEILKGKVFIRNSTITKKLPSFTMAISYAADQQKPIIIAAMININEILSTYRRFSGFTAFVLDSEYNLFSHSNPKLILNPLKVIDLSVLIGVKNEQSLGVTKEYIQGNIEMIGGFADVGIGGLLAVINIPKTAAFLTARSLLENLMVVALILLLVTVFISLIWSYRITRPLVRLTKAAYKVGEGDFDVNVSVSSSDEIAELTISFNNMATGLQERDEKLKRANNLLIQSEKMSAFGQISAGIAHEVKNPLTGILGYTQLAMRKLDENDPLMRNLKIIEKETQRTKSIIENLMQFARSENTELELIDVNIAIEHATTIVDHQLGINQVTISNKLDSNLPLIMGNSNQLEQVIMNLVINAQQAITATGSSGKVFIKTVYTNDNKLEIRVSDSGPGISPDIQKKLFEPFFTTKRAGEGTGLGLSVSYGIIQAHHGNIRIKSSLGHGTIFIITLPVPETVEQRIENKPTGTGGI